MWKKDEASEETPESRPDGRPRSERPEAAAGPGKLATIGRSISIKGEVTGDEDLLIQGRVDGSVELKEHAVTVGAEGEVTADIVGRVVTVEGKVDGNIKADEQAVLRSSAVVQGDITAPRVVLEDGARFRGGVDMGEVSGRTGRAAGGPRDQARKETDLRTARPETAGVSAGKKDETEEKKKEASASKAEE